MITVGDKTIKLQIWDTVNLNALRLDSSPSNPSLAATTDPLLEPFLSTISQIVSHILMFPVGLKRPRLMVTPRCVLWWWVTNVIWNLSNN